MAGLSTDTILEHKPCYKVRDGRHATVVLSRVSDSDSPPLTASLINLSERGARLSIESCVPTGEIVLLELAIDQLDFNFQSVAKVDWTQPGKGSDYLVTCTFRPQMPVHILDTFVDSGLLERRDSVRRYVSLPVTIRRELDGEAESARLHDYSDGGFCVVTSHPVEVGQRLSMEYEVADDSQSEVWAQVRWALRTKGLTRAGCSISSSEDFGCLRALER